MAGPTPDSGSRRVEVCSATVQQGYDNPISATLIALRDQLKGSDERALDVRDRLDGKTALVTGANRGLGRAIASQLAVRGARLVMPVRGDGSEALADVRRAGAGGELLHVDLADTDSVHRLADALKTRDPVDVLVLNAGVVPAASRATKQGFELQNGVNFLANVLLVRRMLEDRSLCPDARVVVVSSESHRSADALNLDALGVADDYGVTAVMERYSYSKLLLTAWGLELGRRTDLTVHVMCPGPVATGIAREAPRWSQPLLEPIMQAFFAPAHVGARPVVYLACAKALDGESRYFHRFDDKPPSELAADPEAGARVLDHSLALLAERAPHPAIRQRRDR